MKTSTHRLTIPQRVLPRYLHHNERGRGVKGVGGRSYMADKDVVGINSNVMYVT